MNKIKLSISTVLGDGNRELPDLWAVDIIMPIPKYSQRVADSKNPQELDCYGDGYIDIGICDDEQLYVLHRLGQNNYGCSTAKKLFKSTDKQQTLVKRYIKRLLLDGVISKEESVELTHTGFEIVPLYSHVESMFGDK